MSALRPCQLHVEELLQCRLMINKLPPFKDLNIRISIIIPIKGKEFISISQWFELRGVDLNYHHTQALGPGQRAC